MASQGRIAGRTSDTENSGRTGTASHSQTVLPARAMGILAFGWVVICLASFASGQETYMKDFYINMCPAITDFNDMLIAAGALHLEVRLSILCT